MKLVKSIEYDEKIAKEIAEKEWTKQGASGRMFINEDESEWLVGEPAGIVITYAIDKNKIAVITYMHGIGKRIDFYE